MNIFISGLGIISPLGIGVKENYEKLYKGKSGISNLEIIDSIHKGKLPVGEIKYSNDDLLNFLQEDTIEKPYSRTMLIALIAIKEALNDAKISKSDIKKYRIGLISASTVGGIRETEQNFEDFIKNKKTEDFISTHSIADATEKIANKLGIKHYQTTINTACSSSSNAITLGSRLLKNNLLDIVIVGGVDTLSKYTINGFSSLLLLDSEPCKPFDNDRKGINLGEGAGFIVLESEESIKTRKINPKAKLKGYGIASDAYHNTATSPDGIGLQKAMNLAFRNSQLTPIDIDYINTHGTGTPNNDLTEGIAMKTVFNKNIPDFSSTKSYTGHCLAAAGAINIIFSVIALTNNFIIGNLNFKNPIPQHGLKPVLKTKKEKKIRNIMSNAIGMGGFCTSIIISKC